MPDVTQLCLSTCDAKRFIAADKMVYEEKSVAHCISFICNQSSAVSEIIFNARIV